MIEMPWHERRSEERFAFAMETSGSFRFFSLCVSTARDPRSSLLTIRVMSTPVHSSMCVCVFFVSTREQDGDEQAVENPG